MSDTGLRILVVDDERAIRRYLRTSLTALGYEVLEAATGERSPSIRDDGASRYSYP